MVTLLSFIRVKSLFSFQVFFGLFFFQLKLKLKVYALTWVFLLYNNFDSLIPFESPACMTRVKSVMSLKEFLLFYSKLFFLKHLLNGNIIFHLVDTRRIVRLNLVTLMILIETNQNAHIFRSK